MKEYQFNRYDVCPNPTEVVIYKNGRSHAIIKYAVYGSKFLYGIDLDTETAGCGFLPSYIGKGYDNLEECLAAAREELSAECMKNIKSGFDVETHNIILKKLKNNQNQLTLF